MCRVLSYLGKPILIEELLYKSDNSFVKQSYHPKFMQLLNLAGFGMVAWDATSSNPTTPFMYKTLELPFYDENLHNLSSKIMPHCLLAHLRGVSYSDKQVVSGQNVHPFMFRGSNIALAHNGVLIDFMKMKFDLLKYIRPEYYKDIKGTTDSEWIYAIFLSQLSAPSGDFTPAEIIYALTETLKILEHVRHVHGIQFNSPVNLFVSDGTFIAATRFVFDYGWQSDDQEAASHFTYHSLWYTYGERYGLYHDEYQMHGNKAKSSIIIASEPLTEDATTWIELPEYTLMVAKFENNEIKIVTHDIHL